LTVILAVIDIPENFRLKFGIGPLTVDRVINPPTLDVTIGRTRIFKSFRTRTGLDLSGGTHLVMQADMEGIVAADRATALESARQVIERRVNFLGVGESVIQSAVSKDSYRLIVELPGITNAEAAVGLIGQTAKLEFREFTEQALATTSATPEQLLAFTVPVGLTGADLARASLVFSPQTGEPQVGIEFTADGAKKFGDITTRLVGKPLAIFLDDFLLSAPRVDTAITGGSGVITGTFTQNDAKLLAAQLNAGALPVPVRAVENRTVGATLGAAVVQKSVRAGAAGLVIVALFMVAQYGILGVLAVAALVLYGLATLALFRIIPVTLTLPGIAGFLLSIGMAVDSNILIFERYKEEKRAGVPWKIAMEHGFGKAWDSIRDANVTTMLTCIILFNPGNWQFLPSSGLVRGFALTLFLGVLIGLFTGIVVTRTFIRVLYREKAEI
jgi:preprotein translocase subunit SecD